MKIILLFIFLSKILLSNDNSIEYSLFAGDILKNKKLTKLIVKIVNKKLEENSDIHLKIKSYTNINEMKRKYKNAEINLLLLSTHAYFKNKVFFDTYSDGRFIHIVNESLYHKYYLIGNNSDENILDNLHEYTLNYEGVSEGSILWFKNYIYKNYKKKYKGSVKETKEINKTNSLVYSVFFKKKNLAVLREKQFLSLVEINPQIAKKIKIIKKSKEIFSDAITLTNKNMTEEERKKIVEVTADLSVLLDNMSFSSRLNISEFKEIPYAEKLKSENFYKEFFLNVEKYEN